MPVKVVDASAIGALVFGEPAAEEVAAKLSAATLAAPALLAFEIANIAVKKLRRHPDQRDALLAGHALFDRLSIEIVAVDSAAVVNVAEETGLTAYGASYLWLARELRVALVTLDAALAVAAGS
ncbi:MAG: PIN domain-containing protein [Rhodospirillales bacterium]|nr:MAG: PIN domain-containing protein [Rhodospirillales bacterium]